MKLPHLSSLGVALLGLAFVKFFFFLSIAQDPIFLYPQIDGKWYHIWAQQLSAGNWLSDKPFYQEPVYPYLLALVYTCFGAKLWVMAFWQILISVFTGYLLFLLTQQLFGTRSAWNTFALYSFFGLLYFYEFQPIKTTLVLFFSTLTLWLCLKKTKFGSWKAGISLGFLTLLRGNTFLLLPWLFFWKWRYHSFRHLVWMLFGTLLPLSVTTLHNYYVSGEFILTTYQGGTNFYIGNNPKATGRYMPLKMRRQTPEYEGKDAIEIASQLSGKPLSYGQVSRFWFQQGWTYLWSHPKEWLFLWGKKMGLFFSPQEFPDGLSYRFFRDQHPWYHLLFVGYPLLWLLALKAGFSIPKRGASSEVKLLFLFLIGSICSVVPFYIFSRYRLPVVVGLLPFAGYALLSKKRVLAGLFVLGIFLQYMPRIDYSNSYYLIGNLYKNLALSSASSSSSPSEAWESAFSAYQNAIKIENKFPEAWEALGTLYRFRGDLTQAEECYRNACRYAPEFVLALYELGGVLISKSVNLPIQERSNYLNEAQRVLQKAYQVDPTDYKVMANLSVLYWNRWQISPQEFHFLFQAKSWLENALRLEPNDAQLLQFQAVLKKY